MYVKICNSSKSLDVPIASQSFACKARTAGTLSLTEVEAASSDSACSRRTEAAIEPAPSAAEGRRHGLLATHDYSLVAFLERLGISDP